jgi:hypothetical protein
MTVSTRGRTDDQPKHLWKSSKSLLSLATENTEAAYDITTLECARLLALAVKIPKDSLPVDFGDIGGACVEQCMLGACLLPAVTTLQ